MRPTAVKNGYKEQGVIELAHNVWRQVGFIECSLVWRRLEDIAQLLQRLFNLNRLSNASRQIAFTLCLQKTVPRPQSLPLERELGRVTESGSIHESAHPWMDSAPALCHDHRALQKGVMPVCCSALLMFDCVGVSV